MKRAARLAVSGALLVVLAVPESYRTVGQTQEEKPVALSTELIVVDALAMNKHTGAPLFDLRKEDFTVYDNGKKQEITQFSRDQLPLSVVLMVNDPRPFLSKRDLRPTIFQSVKGVLRGLKEEDEVALVVPFVQAYSEIEHFTRIKGVIEDRLTEIYSRKSVRLDELRTGIYSAARLAGETTPSPRRRIIIAVTKSGKNFELKSWLPSEQETERELLNSGAAVYGILVDDHDIFGKLMFKHPVGIAFDKTHLAGNIRKYALISGGSTVEVKDPDDAGRAAQRILDDLRASYTLAYYPANRKLDGKFRKIEVKISRGVEQRENGVIVRTRKGYYAVPLKSLEQRSP